MVGSGLVRPWTARTTFNESSTIMTVYGVVTPEIENDPSLAVVARDLSMRTFAPAIGVRPVSTTRPLTTIVGSVESMHAVRLSEQTRATVAWRIGGLPCDRRTTTRGTRSICCQT